MRAILRRILLPLTTTVMASSTPNPKRPTLRSLIPCLRLYKPPPAGPPGGDGVDDRGTVFSQLGLVESAAAPLSEKFRPKRAAVLVCLFEGEELGDLRVVLTKRSANLSTHPGEVSLPGGKAEEGDADDGTTALREAEEEIGLDPKLVTVVTVLEPFLSKHLLRVVPVIGILTDKQAFKPVLNAAEVEAVFDAPLEMFLKDENRRSEEGELLGAKYLVHYFDFETGTKKYVIWGLTASILIRAASVIYKRPPSFLEQESNFKVPNHFNKNHSRQ